MQAENTITASPPVGRPRDPRRHEAVLSAARSQLAEVGYDGFSIKAVAGRAGVGRPLIYRWWPSKVALVCESLLTQSGGEWPRHYPGPLRRDLRSFIGSLVAFAARPEMRRGLPGLTADLAQDAHLSAWTAAQFLPPLRASYDLLLGAAVQRGDQVSVRDEDALFETIRGAVTWHMVMAAATSEKKVIDHLVDLFERVLIC
jgi:AcrR family transcriptional regulator